MIADFGPPWRDYVDYLPPNQHAIRETAFDHSFYKFGLGQGLQIADFKKDLEYNSLRVWCFVFGMKDGLSMGLLDY